MDIRQSLGNKIRDLRRQNKMSQEDLAEALDIRTSSLSALETGKSFPSYVTIMGLCKVFNILPKEFFTGILNVLNNFCIFSTQ